MGIKINSIYNKDCMKLMKKMDENSIDIVLTSPPYNTTGSNSNTKASLENYDSRYDIHIDNMTEQEYLDWSLLIFNNLDRILKPNGVILYNVSYGNENPNIMWLLVSEVIRNTPFMIADNIVWKKKNALPNNSSSNKLTRITELVLVICRKSEFKTFKANKKISSFSQTGQAYYECSYNLVEARNNDGVCKLNKATYSTELCEKLLSLYGTDGDVVYDPFMGTGTTALACLNIDMDFIGSELSLAQCEYALDRIQAYYDAEA